MKRFLRVVTSGLLWLLGVACFLLALFACVSVPVTYLGRTPLGFAVATLMLIALTTVAWLVLRSRLEVPIAVWIILAVDLALNLWAYAMTTLSYRAFAGVSPEAVATMIEGTPYAWSTGELVYRLVVVQGTLAAAALLAYLLRRRGPLFKSKRGRIGGRVALAGFAVFLAVSTWAYVTGFYGFVNWFGRSSTASSGQTVSIAGGAASVTVPPGWTADVHTTAPNPPWWLFVPRSYVEQSSNPVRVILRATESQALTQSQNSTGTAVLLVFRTEAALRDRMSEDLRRSGGSRFNLPASGNRQAPETAWISTRTAYDGGWHTSVRAYYPDRETPMGLFITIPHTAATPPTAQEIADCLAPFHIRPR